MVNWQQGQSWDILPNIDNQFNSFEQKIGKVWSTIKNIWGHLNVEYKHHDMTGSGTMNTTPFFIDLTPIPAGITGSTSAGIDVGYRDGDKIRMKTLQLKGMVQGVSTNTHTINMMLVKHYDNFQTGPSALGYTGTGPKFSEIYDTNTGNGNYRCMLRKNENVKQYKILASRQMTISGAEDEFNERTFNVYFKFKRRAGSYVEWEGTGSNDPSNGKIYFISWSESQTGTSPTITWSSRVTYIDN